MKKNNLKILLFFSTATGIIFFQNCSKFQTLNAHQDLTSMESNSDPNTDSNANSNNPSAGNQNNSPAPQPQPVPSPQVSLDKNWTHRPAGFVTLNDTPHNALGENGWDSVYGIDTIVNDSTDPISPSGVLQQKFPAGLVGGNGGGGGSFIRLSKDLDKRYSEFYHAFWMKIDSQFEQHPVFTKISWLHTGLDQAVAGNQLFTGLTGPQGGPYSINANYQNGNIDNGHLGGGVIGTVRLDPRAESYKIIPGQWAKIEIYWKQSTCNTCRNGTYAVWVNDVSAVDVKNLNTDRIAIDSVSYITVWGGTGTVKKRDSYLWFAHSYLAVPQI